MKNATATACYAPPPGRVKKKNIVCDEMRWMRVNVDITRQLPLPCGEGVG